MKNTITAIVNGEYQYPTMPKPKQFTEKVTFTMIPPDDDVHYGTGYYMSVTGFANGYDQLIDVRYEGTTDVEKLATEYIKNHWGNNLRNYEFINDKRKAKFVVGKQYEEADRFDPITIVKRTEKCVVASSGSHTWRMLVRHDSDGNEYVTDSSVPAKHRPMYSAKWQVE